MYTSIMDSAANAKREKKMRTFVPSTRFVGGTSVETKIDRWVCTSQRGVQVFYGDGLSCRSSYSLRELLAVEKPNEIDVK